MPKRRPTTRKKKGERGAGEENYREREREEMETNRKGGGQSVSHSLIVYGQSEDPYSYYCNSPILVSGSSMMKQVEPSCSAMPDLLAFHLNNHCDRLILPVIRWLL